MGVFESWRRKHSVISSKAAEHTLDEKRPLKEIERAVLEMAISTMDAGQAEARAQLAVATYGGLAHLGTHVCFMIDLPDDVELTAHREVLELAVDSTPDTHQSIEVFIADGRLSSVDLTTYNQGDEDSTWPTVDRIHPVRARE